MQRQPTGKNIHKIAAMAVACLLATLLLIMPAFAQDDNSDIDDETGDTAATIQESEEASDDGSESEGVIEEQADAEGSDAPSAFIPATDWRNAGAPSSNWVTITPDTRHWYRFKYSWDREDDDPDNAFVEMRIDPAGCAGFDVQTQGRLDFPFDDDGEFVGPIGRGTPFTKPASGDEETFRDEARLVWVGSAAASETYYVIVIPRTQGECRYQLSIEGPTVSF